MTIDILEVLKGIIGGGFILGAVILIVVYLYLMVRFAFQFDTITRSYVITKRFGEGSNLDRIALRDHLMKHGMTYKQSADCMNSWERPK